jgi:hypothetical protein
MKKQAKKLMLAKETVRNLESSDLLKAAGRLQAIDRSLWCPSTSIWYECWGTAVSCNSVC